MQMTNGKCSLKEVACRSLDCNLRWEDNYNIRITLDARRNTRRTLQTEMTVMLIILPKGQKGVDRFQKAVYHLTIGVWTGKDSRNNMPANMAKLYEEIEILEQDTRDSGGCPVHTEQRRGGFSARACWGSGNLFKMRCLMRDSIRRSERRLSRS